MDRLRVVVFCFIVVLVCGSSLAVVAQDAEDKLCIPMDSIEIAPPESVEAKRSSVAFPHALHFDFSCQTCHHKWEKDANLTGCMTSGCHDLEVSPKKGTDTAKVADAGMKYYKTAYHSMCIGCHKEIKKQNKALAASGKVLTDKLPNTGPTGCNGCHPKE